MMPSAARTAKQGAPTGTPALLPRVPPFAAAATLAIVRPGEVIAGRFEIGPLLGAGGMGEVFRATDRRTGQTVALKLLGRGAAENRFEREAELLAELRHPAIVAYVAHGFANGRPFIAMEWLEGEDLEQRLARGPLSASDTLVLARRLAEGLAAAHARGAVHRDVKPANVLLPAGRVADAKLLDFGIARLVGAARRMTATGTLIGTPGYMAPEQARGERVDARADVFSLGCVLFECLTGRAPFAADHVIAILAKILLENPPSVHAIDPTIPAPLEAAVTAMLEKAPANRPQDGDAVLRALASIDGIPVRNRPPPASLTASERRIVSVVVAAGEADAWTTAPTLTAQEEREDARALREKLTQTGAQVDMLSDGTVVASFTSVGAATDRAALAARAALTLARVRPGAPVAMATGWALVTGDLPVGEVIDRAADLVSRERGRLRSAGGPLGARICTTTAGLLGDGFALVEEDGQLFLTGERQRIASTRTLMGRATPFVGRRRELSMLTEAYAETIEEGIANAVVLTGPPGIGKSRLRWELVRRLQGSEGDIRGPVPQIWLARGDTLTAGAPFGLVTQLISDAAGIVGGEPLPVRRERLRARVGRHLDRDVLRVARFLGELVDTPFDDDDPQLAAARQEPSLMGEQMRRAWLSFVEAECASGPLVLVLEDLHHGDLPSVALIDGALGELAEAPLLVLALARPELREVFPDLWPTRRVVRAEVHPVGRRAATELASSVLGADADPARVERLTELACGNPFCLEELLRAVTAGEGDTLPDTVLAMVEGRIEALPAPARRVLRAASVFGQTARGRAVHALIGEDGSLGATMRLLDDLVDGEVLERRGGTGDGNDEEYGFRHAMVRDAAYESLIPDNRVLGHRLAAHFLSREGDAPPLVLAEHFERGGEPARAIRPWLRAAEQALEGNDLAAAVERAARGIAAGAVGEERGQLRLVHGEAVGWQGRHAEARAAAEEALACFTTGSALWFRALADVGATSSRVGDLERLRAGGRALCAAAPQDDAHHARASACGRVALFLLFADQEADADLLMERVRDSAELGTSPAGAAWLDTVRAFRARLHGDPAEYVRLTFSAVESFERMGDVRNAYLHRCNAAASLIEIGRAPEARELLRDVLVAAQRLGNPYLVAVTKTNLAEALAPGDPERVVLAGEAAATYAQHGHARMEGQCRQQLAKGLLDAGDLDRALTEARRSVELLENRPPAPAPCPRHPRPGPSKAGGDGRRRRGGGGRVGTGVHRERGGRLRRRGSHVRGALVGDRTRGRSTRRRPSDRGRHSGARRLHARRADTPVLPHGRTPERASLRARTRLRSRLNRSRPSHEGRLAEAHGVARQAAIQICG